VVGYILENRRVLVIGSNVQNCRLLVCGKSQVDYLREETIIEAIQGMPFKKLYDKRSIDDIWLKLSIGVGFFD
jgi:hypothetical protein